MSQLNFEPFFIDTNQCWGDITSILGWVEFLKTWSKGIGLHSSEIYDLAKFNTQNSCDGVMKNFGTRSEHVNGDLTLRQFFIENGMEIITVEKQ